MRDNAGVPAFVGRSEPLARLAAACRTRTGPGGASPSWASLVLVTGEAGIGKTALLTQFADQAAVDGFTVLWGTCWDGELAPAWWPWTQALRALLDQRHGLADAVRPELAAILPHPSVDRVDAEAPGVGADAAARVRVFDAVAHVLRRAAADAPVVVVLDDLHWADQSTVDLLRFLTHEPRQGALTLIGAYRPYEPPPGIAASLTDLATTAELVRLEGLSAGEVADLVNAVTGAAAPEHWARLVHERSGGHPFYARELCQLLASTGSASDVPAAVREVIGRRLARLSRGCAALLDAAAVAGTASLADVLAEVTGEDPSRVAELTAGAAAAGILAPSGDVDGVRFVHDLYRETVYTGLAPARRLDLHHRVANALLGRQQRGSPVFAAELAYHFTAAVPAAGTGPALVWAHRAAQADATRFAFVEGAGHLSRVRNSVSTAGQSLSNPDLVGLLTAEADLRLRSGDAERARELLDAAWTHATATGEDDLVGAVALGLDRLDARFAMPRADLVAVLTTARAVLHGTGTKTEAKVTAALARQLQHSVPAERPQARPLADEAVRTARTIGDPATLASCLLSQHDTLWTPGTADVRAEIAAEIAELAKQADEPERHAQALLLSATAQLENGSPAFRATLAEFIYMTERLHQPRHDYLLRTRQAALALLDGDIETGERLSIDAVVLGESVGEGDTGNVRMSQRLEIVRARNEPGELREMAAEAVQWWIGLPAHAHSVAAGFYARAGDLDAARRELDTVLALEDWRTDRSYMWSIFVGEVVTAAIALHDRGLCEQLLEELLPVARTCAVNGALVCYMGAHAHRVGLLNSALGRPEPARRWLHQALETHGRLGARAWLAETHRVLGNLGGPEAVRHARRAGALYTELQLTSPVPTQRSGASITAVTLRRAGDMWEAGYGGRTAYIRDTKGLHDLAALLAQPGTDVSALSLAGGEISHRAHTTGADPILDRTALLAYRRRLSELDDELAMAHSQSDLARQQSATDEREHLLAELRRATRPSGSPRTLANPAAERARKAVTARIRDAIRRIADAHPELGAHLDRAIRTGATCRYEPNRVVGLRPVPGARADRGLG